MTLRRLVPILLVVGVALLVPFEDVFTRIAGVACLVAFVVCGLFAVATPEFLGREDDEPDLPRR